MATRRLDITTEELFEQDIFPGLEELWIDYATEYYEINNPINLIETDNQYNQKEVCYEEENYTAVH